MASEAHNALSLLKPYCLGTDSNPFGKAPLEPILLTLAAAMEGSSLSTGSVLFTKLPLEVLYMVIGYLDREGLAKVALLNSDCRQLARTWQFRSWSCYQNPKYLALLLSEAVERANNSGKTRKAALGACISTIYIANRNIHLTFRHHLSLEGAKEIYEEAKLQVRDIVDVDLSLYLIALERIIKGALPSLQTTQWKEEQMTPSLLKAILMSPVRTLELDRVCIDDTLFKAFSDDMTAVASHLEALTLRGFPYTRAMHPFVYRLLQHCGPGLKFLLWDEFMWRKIEEFCDLKCEIPPLVELRKLILKSIKVRSQADAESLILPTGQCKLIHLELEYPNALVSKYMKSYAEMPTLKSLIWDHDDDSFSAMQVFLCHNKQLELLACQELTEYARDMRLLPMLASTHHRLLSLEVGTNNDVKTISETALSAIAQMKTLRKLHLKAGFGEGWWQTDWLVDHEAIRNCVSQLPNLKLLALSRDTYDHGRDPTVHESPQSFQYERYYSSKYIAEFLDRTEARLARKVAMTIALHLGTSYEQWAERRAENEARSVRIREAERNLLYDWQFELIHRRRILKEANRYVKLRYEHNLGGPRLEMLYIGQLPIKIVQGWSGKPVAMAMTEHRHECWNWLSRVFRGRESTYYDD